MRGNAGLAQHGHEQRRLVFAVAVFVAEDRVRRARDDRGLADFHAGVTNVLFDGRERAGDDLAPIRSVADGVVDEFAASERAMISRRSVALPTASWTNFLRSLPAICLSTISLYRVARLRHDEPVENAMYGSGMTSNGRKASKSLRPSMRPLSKVMMRRPFFSSVFAWRSVLLTSFGSSVAGPSMIMRERCVGA
jgi:hypothetical protein